VTDDLGHRWESALHPEDRARYLELQLALDLRKCS